MIELSTHRTRRGTQIRRVYGSISVEHMLIVIGYQYARSRRAGLPGNTATCKRRIAFMRRGLYNQAYRRAAPPKDMHGHTHHDSYSRAAANTYRAWYAMHHTGLSGRRISAGIRRGIALYHSMEVSK